MFQKIILLMFVISIMSVTSGCKVIEEYAKASRKYNSNRTYRQNNKKPYVDAATSKMILDHCRRSR